MQNARNGTLQKTAEGKNVPGESRKIESGMRVALEGTK